MFLVMVNHSHQLVLLFIIYLKLLLYFIATKIQLFHGGDCGQSKLNEPSRVATEENVSSQSLCLSDNWRLWQQCDLPAETDVRKKTVSSSILYWLWLLFIYLFLYNVVAKCSVMHERWYMTQRISVGTAIILACILFLIFQGLGSG